MRPIERGPVPQEGGTAKTVADYKDWRQDLIDRIGCYCSYCNMVLNDSPQVEHVSPKSLDLNNPAITRGWDNMVLACGPCNRAKSDQPTSPPLHYLPDYHNTHLAFEYYVLNHPSKPGKMACLPKPAIHAWVNAAKVQRTLDLCRLQALTSSPRATDLRWSKRYEASLDAALWRQHWASFGHTVAGQFIDLLMTAALTRGFFSIWYTTFDGVPQVQDALAAAFPNTADCLLGGPVRRTGPADL